MNQGLPFHWWKRPAAFWLVPALPTAQQASSHCRGIGWGGGGLPSQLAMRNGFPPPVPPPPLAIAYLEFNSIVLNWTSD